MLAAVVVITFANRERFTLIKINAKQVNQSWDWISPLSHQPAVMAQLVFILTFHLEKL